MTNHKPCISSCSKNNIFSLCMSKQKKWGGGEGGMPLYELIKLNPNDC